MTTESESRQQEFWLNGWHQRRLFPGGGTERMSDVGTFSAGIIAGEILTTAAYLTFLKTHEEGDIHGIHEAIGLSHNQIAGLIAIPAVLDSWRLLDSQPPKWLPIAAKIYKGSGVVFVWTF